MLVLRLKTGEKTAVDKETAYNITSALLTGSELIIGANNIVFPRELFQSLMPSMK